MTKTYDLICSLGGNCTVGNALRFRHLREFSLPFDWCYMVNEKTINILSECFKKDKLFSIALKENLVPLTDEEEKSVTSHNDTIHYKDNYSGYYFVNHFSKSIENGGYDDFREIFERRLKRLITCIEKSQNILFILGTAFQIDTDVITELQITLTQKYPDKNIEFEVIEFSCNEDAVISENNKLTIRKFKREVNLYDFVQTNIEWSFMDDILLSDLFKNKLPLYKKIFIQLCPIKDFRRTLRKIYIKK